MANQDEPITNNPLLPFLRIPSFKSTSALPPSLTPIQTLAVGQQARAAKLGDIRMEEEEGEGTKGEGAVKPLWRHCCPNYRVLYMKEGEIRLLGFHVSTKKKLNRIQTQTSPNITKYHQTLPNPPNFTIVVQVSSSAPAMLLVLGLLLTTAGETFLSVLGKTSKPI